jgi:predicted porin
MKKSLIALAVLAASGAAMAQSSVTIYGIADIWVGKSTNKVDNGVTTTKTSNTLQQSGGWDTSRIGFKGTEHLGGGLKANFAIETAIALDQPTPTSLGDRVAYVGFSGGFGEVQLGRVWTAYDEVWGAHNNGFDSVFTARPTLGYTDNPNNGFKYLSPSFGGFTAAVSYAMGEDKTATTSAGSVTAFNVAYNNGPISAAIAYQQEKAGATPARLNLEGIAGALAAGDKLTNTQVSGSYDLGIAKLLATYNQGKVATAGNPDVKSNEYSLGAEVPLSAAFSAGFGYGQQKIKVAGVEQAKVKAYSLTGVYTLSKRTIVYAGYVNNKATSPLVAGSIKDTTYAAGVQHKF